MENDKTIRDIYGMNGIWIGIFVFILLYCFLLLFLLLIPQLFICWWKRNIFFLLLRNKLPFELWGAGSGFRYKQTNQKIIFVFYRIKRRTIRQQANRHVNIISSQQHCPKCTLWILYRRHEIMELLLDVLIYVHFREINSSHPLRILVPIIKHFHSNGNYIFGIKNNVILK